jgi:glutamate-ammonia-ligase adenylyltransferase
VAIPENNSNLQTAANLPELISGVPFADPDTALRNLKLIGERVPAAVVKTLVAFLADAADPDQAVNYFERLVSSEKAEFGALFERVPIAVHYAVAIFANSQWLGETLVRNPDKLYQMAREKSLSQSWSCDEYREAFARFRSRSFETDISLLLARFKRREYLRILVRDVLGAATLAETTAEISALSDVLIEEGLSACETELRNRYGWPQHYDAHQRLVPTPFAVLSLGKLGGKELNYSSDIDLLYIYGEGDDAGASRVSGKEFFIRLAQEVTNVLGSPTSEGPVFRIDLRLRPMGHEGEPAVSLARALDYYANVAHGWELQALLKARHSAGDLELARRFIRGTQPYVYTSELNFAAIKTALVSLQKIKRFHRPAQSATGIDVKLDTGGIRDIEFLVQCLQRVYGGSEPWLRSSGTLFALQKLHDKEHLSGRDFHRLNNAYVFLRKIEHRLQLRMGQQTHRLPNSEAQLRVLQRAVMPDARSVESFLEILRSRMQAVGEIYNRMVHQQRNVETQIAEIGLAKNASVPLEALGEQGSSQLLSRLQADSPPLAEFAAQAALGSVLRKNVHRFLSAATTSAERYKSVLENAAKVKRAASIFAHSHFATDLLVRNPEQIHFVGEHEALQHSLTARIQELHDQHEIMAELRACFRRASFMVTARDVLQPRSVWSSLGELTAAADEVVSAALAASNPPQGFAIFALGRLGACEFDLLSDADLVFMRAEDTSSEEAARAAARVVELLAAYTREGTTFVVDTRLRPHGSQGELVITPTRLEHYIVHDAQAWEALSYQKARFVAGDLALADYGRKCGAIMLENFRTRPQFRDELFSMRSRLEALAGRELNLKLSAGGVYDLDFIAGYCAIRSGVPVAASNVLERLYALAQHGALDEQAMQELRPAAEFLRTVEHAVRLVDGHNRKSLPENAHSRASVAWFVERALGRPFSGSLEEELRHWMTVVRRRFFSTLQN